MSGADSRHSFGSLSATGVLLLAGIVLLLAIYFYFAISNPNSGTFSDSVRYLFMADYFHGVTDALTAQMARESIFPPMFPFVLSVFGAGTETISIAHIVVVLALLIACTVCFWWLSLHQVTINERLMALLLLLLLPGVFFQALLISSEFLFLAWVLGSLAAMEKSRSEEPQAGAGKRDYFNHWILLAALLAGLSITTRTIGIALLPSLILACRSMGYRKLIPAAVLSLGPYLLWQLLRDSSLDSRSYMEIYSLYLEQFSFAEIIHNFGIQPQIIWESWIRIFDRMPGTHTVLLHSLLLISVSPVFVLRLARLKSEAVFLLVYLAIIMLWPFPREIERFVIILVPIFLFYCLLTIKYIIRKFELSAISHLLAAALFGVILISITPSLYSVLRRYSMPAPEALGAHRYSTSWYEKISDSDTIADAHKIEKVYQLLRAVDDHIGEEECVYTTARDFVTLYSRRLGKNLPRDLYTNADDGYRFEINELDKCNYVVMIPLQPIQTPEYVSMYPIQALENHMEPILVSTFTHNEVEQLVSVFARIVR